jgi:hypothetical protein
MLLLVMLVGGAVLLLVMTVPATWATPTQHVARSTLPTPAAPGSIIGTVFEDRNRNGFLGGGEPGLSGVTLTLTSGITTPQVATTNLFGDYTFTDLVAEQLYTVTESDLPGYFSTSPNVVTATASVTSAVEVHFGDHPFIILLLPAVFRSP